MLQRKQTLFLLCVMILSFVGVLLPLGTIEPEGMGVGDMVYNICIRKGDGGMSLSVLPLFILDVLVFIISLLTIFLYKNRLLQAKLCISCILLLVVWYVYLILLDKHILCIRYFPCRLLLFAATHQHYLVLDGKTWDNE